jgi:hypothetical protein
MLNKMKILLVAATLVPAFAFASKSLENIELKWKATTELTELQKLGLTAIPAKIKIEKFKDDRKPDLKNKIGENLEDEKKGTILPVTTISDVGEFVTNNFRDVMKKGGLTIVDSGEDYVLSGSVIEYFVTEKDTYEAALTLKLKLTKKGKVVWSGTTPGVNKRFGRSYKLDNYLECFSDVIIDAAESLAKSNEFKEALGK